MATITTNDDFVNACNWLIAQGQLTVTVARFINPTERKVYDETTPITDITPDTATLESALDSANAEISENETKAIARTLMLSDAKNYLSAQLQSASPNITTIYNTVKNYVDNNTTLSQMLSNQISLFNTAYGVTINTVTPTAADRTRYLICCQLVLATIA